MQGFVPCNGCTEPTILEALQLATVVGCYAEFGVFRGNSFAAALSFSDKDQRKLITSCYGFDSFVGFPQPEHAMEKMYTGGTMHDTSYEMVMEKLAGLKCQLPYYMVKGFFKDSFPVTELPKISVCLVDCDSYTSSKAVLDYVRPKMQDGSIIVFDDYYLDDACQKTAVNELIADGQKLEFVKEVKTPDWHVPIYIWRNNESKTVLQS